MGTDSNALKQAEITILFIKSRDTELKPKQIS